MLQSKEKGKFPQSETCDKKLNQFEATSICGNDITSSSFYVVGICTFYAGIYSPLMIALVSGVVLYVFRDIYAEILTMLPVNGGCYTLTLNSSSKFKAALAGCLSILSYIATAVVSASVAITYLNNLVPSISPIYGTIVILGLFAMLLMCGISESSRVASCIFAVHITVMSILVIDCLIAVSQNGSQQLVDNWNDRNAQLPNGNFPYGIVQGMLYGFASSMLGITGFETSANFVQEQKPGVFPKTLRNMWYIVAFFNISFSVLSLCVLPLHTVMGYPLLNGLPQNGDILIQMASSNWLKTVVSLDAFFVLAGAVLTSFVGIRGLTARMASDGSLPLFLSNDRAIAITFFLVCSSLYLVSNEDILTLGGVYSIAFVLVMASYATGNLMLKIKLPKVSRVYRASYPKLFTAIAACLLAAVVNIAMSLRVFFYFLLYAGGIALVVMLTRNKASVLRTFISVCMSQWDADEYATVDEFPEPRVVRPLLQSAAKRLKTIRDTQHAVFIKRSDLCMMRLATEFLKVNEMVESILFVYLEESEAGRTSATNLRNNHINEERFDHDMEIIKKVFPKLRFDMAVIKHEESMFTGEFDQQLYKTLESKLCIPKTRMFIFCRSSTTRNLAELEGARVIIYTKW